jgi:hypothetical protein
MRIFMYVLKHDGGFAPNPFHGWCTLACCKPAIRRRARPGDWVLGITPKGLGNRLAFAMQVEEALTFEDYWRDRRFRRKRPRWEPGRTLIEKCGDNCYEPKADGTFRQMRSMHWDRENDREDGRAKARDLRGKYVLVSRRFSYFGEQAPSFPAQLASLRLPARFLRVNFSEEEEAALLRFLVRLPRGVRGRPRGWRKDDVSWRQGRARCG